MVFSNMVILLSRSANSPGPLSKKLPPVKAPFTLPLPKLVPPSILTWIKEFLVKKLSPFIINTCFDISGIKLEIFGGKKITGTTQYTNDVSLYEISKKNNND
ncbi:hypothetical protein ACTA71_009380 [Dictyostelium dimigraforme]